MRRVGENCKYSGERCKWLGTRKWSKRDHNWVNLEYVLKIEPTEFPDKRGYEKERPTMPPAEI